MQSYDTAPPRIGKTKGEAMAPAKAVTPMRSMEPTKTKKSTAKKKPKGIVGRAMGSQRY